MKKMIFRNSMIYNQNFLIPVSMKSIINFYSMCFSLNSLISRMVATLQVVHNNDHWVLVAKTEAGHVSIYDSLALSCWRKRPHTLSCASSLLQTSEKHLLYKVKSCQQQNNGFDCGVFVVAFATSIAHGVDPNTVIYDRRSLRSHLQKCLAADNLTPFPWKKGCPTRGKSTQSEEEVLQKERVYCSCRRTEHSLPTKGWDMVQCDGCKEWYQRMCHRQYPKWM